MMGIEYAFSGMEYDDTAGQRYHYGMGLRDYFAAKAMPAILQSFGADSDPGSAEEVLKQVAVTSYEMADQMMEARKAHD